MTFYKFSITRIIYLKQFVKFLTALLLLQEFDYYTPLFKLALVLQFKKKLNWLWPYFEYNNGILSICYNLNIIFKKKH
jgi:hypothetical protein